MKIKNNDHSLIHSAKVALFCAILAEKEGLTEKDTLILMLSAVVHDIGMINNINDTNHGKLSLEKLMKYDIKEAVGKIVELHCKADFKAKLYPLMKYFKDCDALDRIRTNDLNVDYLRIEKTKTLLEFSKNINFIINEVRR